MKIILFRLVLVNCLKCLSRVLTEREDLFNALDDIGIAWSEQKISLIKRHGKFKDTDQFVLNEIIRDMDRIREKRIREIVKLSKKSVSDVQKSKRNVEKLALRDMNNIQKIEKKKCYAKYGSSEGKKKFYEKRENYNFDEYYEAQRKYYYDFANIDIAEAGCKEIKERWQIEYQNHFNALQKMYSLCGKNTEVKGLLDLKLQKIEEEMKVLEFDS